MRDLLMKLDAFGTLRIEGVFDTLCAVCSSYEIRMWPGEKTGGGKGDVNRCARQNFGVESPFHGPCIMA